jgi:hypothetical protein
MLYPYCGCVYLMYCIPHVVYTSCIVLCIGFDNINILSMSLTHTGHGRSFSGTSLGYVALKGPTGYGGSVTIQISVLERYLELMKQHQLITEGKAPSIPLLAQLPAATAAILICKVLVPSGAKAACLDVAHHEYSTPVAARVYPHLLVHVGVNTVTYRPVVVQQPSAPVAFATTVARPVYHDPYGLPGSAARAGRHSRGRRWCAMFCCLFLGLIVMSLICVYALRRLA